MTQRTLHLEHAQGRAGTRTGRRVFVRGTLNMLIQWTAIMLGVPGGIFCAAAGASDLYAAQTQTVSGDTPVSLALLLGGVTIAVTTAWRMSAVLSKMRYNQMRLQQRLRALEDAMEHENRDFHRRRPGEKDEDDEEGPD